MSTTTPSIPSTRQPPGGGLVTATIWLAVLVMVPTGVWMLADPTSFAEFVQFPPHTHYLHDAGAFQLGIGAALLLALIWQDARAVALAGFLVGNTVHAVNHAADLDLGGRVTDAWALLAVTLLTAVALGVRLRQLGWVVGQVTAITTPALAPFVRQKTALLTTYRRNGRPGSSPLSVAVDGDRAYLRSFDASLKTKRMRRNPEVELRPSTMRGRPNGAAIHGRVRELHGAEYRHAAWLLRRKYPLLHGLAVPFLHKVMRGKFGGTTHFELTPEPGLPPRGSQPRSTARHDRQALDDPVNPPVG